MLQITNLPSGLRVATYKINRKISAINIKIRGGFRFEEGRQVGLSHFLEHELFEGTRKYPTAQLLNDSVEALGGNINARTNYEEITYNGNILLEHLPQLIDTISQQLQHSLLTPGSIRKEKNIIEQEWHKRKDDNQIYLRGHLINEALWPDQTLSNTIDENLENLENIDQKSLREFLHSFYNTANMVVCLAGDVDHQEWVEKLAQAFSILPRGTAPSFQPVVSNPKAGPRLVIRNINQVKLSLCYYGPGRDNRSFYATALLTNVLGLRLFYKLVYESGLAYQSWTDFHAYLDTGSIDLGGGFAPGQARKFIEQIFDEIKRVKEEPPGEDELRAAKARHKSGIVRTNESVFGLANSYAKRIIREVDPLLLEDELKNFDEVSTEEVQEAANKWLVETFKLAAIGPEKDIKELEKPYIK